MRDVMWQARHWLLLVAGQSVFFIFVAWVAYPAQFPFVVGLMIVVTLVLMALGIVLTMRQQRIAAARLEAFLQEPSLMQEEALVAVLPAVEGQAWQRAGRELRALLDAQNAQALAMRDYETFIEGWVHEVKTPLSLMQLVLQNRQDEISPLVHQRLDYAKRTMQDQVERILFYAKLQATHVDYRLKRLSLADCVEDVLLDLQSLLEEEGVTVTVDVAARAVVSDERALQFICTQLLVNAVKYRRADVASAVHITAHEDAAGGTVLRIRDNGRGVLPEDLPFIFDKGFTGTMTRQKESTGMGLYLVKRLCEALGIEVQATSAAGEGLCVELTFPEVQ